MSEAETGTGLPEMPPMTGMPVPPPPAAPATPPAEERHPYDVHFHAMNKEAALKHLNVTDAGLPRAIKYALMVMVQNLDGDAPVEVEANNHDENWGHHHLSVRHIRLIG